MNFRRSTEDEPEINLIPLIDVLLMALIFLIVTTSFSSESRLAVQLPEAAAEKQPELPVLRVTIDARGQYYINEQQLLNNNFDSLRNAMAREIGANPKERMVVVHADAKTPHEAVVRVMDAARRLGLSKLSFATQQPAESGP